MKTAFLSALAIVLFATANAQTSQTQTVTLNLTNKIDITLVSGSDGSVFNFDATSEYLNGLTNEGAAEFNVKSNRPWKVTVAAKTPKFAYSLNGSTAATVEPNTDMPASVLGIRLNKVGNYSSLTTSDQQIAVGARGDSNFKIDYQATPGFLYDAGQYQLDVVYTATQQ